MGTLSRAEKAAAAEAAEALAPGHLLSALVCHTPLQLVQEVLGVLQLLVLLEAQGWRAALWAGVSMRLLMEEAEGEVDAAALRPRTEKLVDRVAAVVRRTTTTMQEAVALQGRAPSPTEDHLGATGPGPKPAAVAAARAAQGLLEASTTRLAVLATPSQGLCLAAAAVVAQVVMTTAQA